MPGARSLAAAAKIPGLLVRLGTADRVGREELAHREADVAEQPAGVLAGAAGTLLLGHAVIVHGDQELGVPLQPHDGELPQRHIDAPRVVPAGQLAAEEAADEGRDLAQVAVAGTAAAGLHQLRIQHDGINGLHRGRYLYTTLRRWLFVRGEIKRIIFDKVQNPLILVCKLKYNLDCTVLMDIDILDKFDQ